MTASSDERLKSGGKAKFLLSGLLVCECCGAHYVGANAKNYACSSHRLGGACSNNVRIPRAVVEAKVLGPIRDELLAPERVDRMAKEMQAYYAEQVRERQRATEEAPGELRELTARIDRLRERLRQGDPDMLPDELQAAIDKAEAKHRELEQQLPEAKACAKVFAMIPRAAAAYRQQIAEGLDGDARAALKARALLRGLFAHGKIVLSPRQDGSLWALYSVQPAVLLRVGTGYRGRGI